MTEAELSDAVLELAQLAGWRVAHFRPARTARGWRTPVAGDGAGFVDLVLAHPDRGILFRELKAERGRVTDAQRGWLDVLELAGADVAVWRPVDWPMIVDTLTGGRATTCATGPTR